MSQVIQTNGLRSAGCAFTLVIAAITTAGCGVEMGAGVVYPGVGYDYPSDAYIATTEPVYFDGRATYWYGGNWYYREGNRWSHYDREPPALQERRMQAAPVRRTYEPSGGRRVASPAGRTQERHRGER